MDKATITPDANGKVNNQTVTVTYKPTAGGNGGYININSYGAERARVKLTGKGVQPTITVNPDSIGFGNVPVQEYKTATFKVSGTDLAGDLVLTSSDTTRFTVRPSTFTPGANGKVSEQTVYVNYKPTGTGSSIGYINIDSYGAERARVKLTGRGVLPSITVDPSTSSSSPYDFGTVKEDSTASHTFTVIGNNLSNSIYLDNNIQFEKEFTVETDLTANGGTVTVYFNPTSGGKYDQAFTLRSGDVSTKIYVSGECAAFNPSPTDLNFGTVNKGNTETRTFTVTGTNLSGNLSLTCTGNYFSVSPNKITPAQAAAGIDVTVTYKPTAGGNHSGTITISGGGAKEKTVNLTGKCAAIDITPSTTHDFGTVNVGTTNTMTFTITGTNLNDVISIDSQQEDGFSISNNLSGNGTVTVTFHPSVAGDYEFTFYVSSSGFARIPITLTGKCVSTITAEPNTIVFSGQNYTVPQDLTVTCAGANSKLQVTTTGNNADCFVGIPDTIDINDARNGKTYKIRCFPGDKQSANATVVISGGGAAEPKTVSLKYQNTVKMNSTMPDEPGED